MGLSDLKRLVVGKWHAATTLSEFARHLQNWREVWARYRRGLPISSPLRFRNGVRLEFGPEDDPIQLFREVFVRRCYTNSWFYRPKPGDVAIDLGANIGSFPLALAVECREIRCHCFEPSTATRARMSRNLEVNGLSGAVRIYPYAVSSSRGAADLRMGASSIHTSLFASDQVEGSRRERINLINFEDVLRLSGERRIAILKVDIEGAEKDLFSSLPPVALGVVERVVLEYHDHIVTGSRQSVESALIDSGFSIVRVVTASPGNGILYARRTDRDGSWTR